MIGPNFGHAKGLAIALVLAGTAGGAQASTFGLTVTTPILTGTFDATGPSNACGGTATGVFDSITPADANFISPTFQAQASLCGGTSGSMSLFLDGGEYLVGTLIDFKFDTFSSLSLLFKAASGSMLDSFDDGFVAEFVATSAGGFSGGFTAKGTITLSAVKGDEPPPPVGAVPLPAGLPLAASGLVLLAGLGRRRRAN